MRAVEFIVERKKRRRRPGYAAYGPGPYGGYGYYAGYSGDSGEGGGDLGEKINPKTLTRGFRQEKDMGWYTLQAVGDFASRMADEPPTMEIYAMLKPEAGKRDGKQIGQLSLKIAQGIFLKDNPGAEALVAGGVIVDDAYKRKGVASSMYQFSKELGNDVIASIDQSDDAVAMWKGMQAKGVQAKGVAEGQDDKAEAYRAHLIKTLPQIMKLFANIGKGWIPSKEQMLSAVDTAYIVMKHTGDAKQAGKALMDELNTLHRMSQGKKGIDENFADGKKPGRKGLAKRSGVNTKASVSSLRKTAKNSSGEKARMAHWLANMKAGRAKKNK